MEELYVVIGTDGVDSWVYSDVSDEELMSEVIYYVEFSSLVGDWLIVDCDGACIEDGFPTELDTREWAIENGYRIADN